MASAPVIIRSWLEIVALEMLKAMMNEVVDIVTVLKKIKFQIFLAEILKSQVTPYSHSVKCTVVNGPPSETAISL